MTHRHPQQTPDAYQDYYPGQVLLALARAVRAGLATGNPNKIERAWRYYRHRFRYKRHWGQVAWLTQAFTAWWRVAQRADFADFVFEVADWTLDYQHEASGAFLTDQQADTPGFTTALYMEGIATALALAQAVGDIDRSARYRHSCDRAVQFVDRLVYHQSDAPVLPRSAWAVGGVRQSLVSSVVRTDYVQHALSAVLNMRVGR